MDQVFIGWFGVGLGFLTMCAAVVAAIYARLAALAAIKSHRAFMDVERARIVAEVSQVLHNPPHIMAVQVVLTNIGKSSAAVLTAHAEYLDGCEYPEQFLQVQRVDVAVGSGKDAKFRIDVFDQMTFDMPPYVGGYVEYRSSFGRTHRSFFFAQIEHVAGSDDGYNRSEPHYVVRANPDHCNRETRERRLGWPADD